MLKIYYLSGDAHTIVNSYTHDAVLQRTDSAYNRNYLCWKYSMLLRNHAYVLQSYMVDISVLDSRPCLRRFVEQRRVANVL